MRFWCCVSKITFVVYIVLYDVMSPDTRIDCPMNLTIAELACAVDRSETYVRQHIHRKHLAVIKEGRRVYVELDEARRWAEERGLPFRSSVRAAMAIANMRDRIARMTVLAWKGPDGQLRNLFTLVRHLRKDGLGPWQREPDGDWRTEELASDFHLLSFDAPLRHCEPLLHRVLDSGTLHAKDLEVDYSLEAVPRRHWAYRDQRVPLDHYLRSPFARHSAEILEYWSFAAHPRKDWREELESSLSPKRSLSARLGFPLAHRSDRIGNLMIARAEDAITCDLHGPHDRTLTLLVEAEDYTLGSHRGTVWASHSGDEVLRRQIAITPGETTIALDSDVDSIGLAVFRVTDGQCVDLMSHHRLMEVSGRLDVQTGPTVRLQDRSRKIAHQVNPFHHSSTIRVSADQHGPEIDRRIRQQRLDYLSHRLESSVRRKGDLVRFEPGKWGQAVGHLLGILAADRDPPKPIYFADPYFMRSAKTPDQIKMWLDIFAATTGAPFLILCGKDRQAGGLPRWWSSAPKPVKSHVTARIVRKHGNGKPAFHDRYLITSKRELLITHSVNGWDSDGVTFASLPYGVYRAEAERFGSMDLRSAAAEANVEELY